MSRGGRHALAFLLFAASLCAPAAEGRAVDRMLFTRIGVREGLSNSSVSAIAQDERGFIWFGTQGGLNRYDGRDFKIFESEPFKPDVLSQDQIQTLFMESDALWIGTYGGLSRLDLRTERFTNYRSEPGREDSLSNDVVVCVTRDARGSLWVGTLSGLNRLDEGTGRFTRFKHDPADPHSLPADVVRDFEVDRSGRLWIATSGGGLARYDYERGDFTTLRRDPADPSTIMSDFVMSIDEDAEGKLWIGTWYGGLSRLDPETARFENIKLADERIYVVDASEPGTVYAGSWGGGLFEYHTSDGSVERYRAEGEAGSLSHDVVYSILRDRSGELWFGTNGGGVNKLARSRRSYEAYRADPRDPSSLALGKVTAIHVDRSGRLWAGVYSGGLNLRDPATGAWKKFRRNPHDPHALPNDIVNAIYEDSSGDLWIATNDGFAKFDRARSDFEVIRPEPGRSDWLANEVIFDLKESPEGGFWVGTYRRGLEYWDRKAGRFIHYPADPADPHSLSDNLVYAIEYDAAGRLWVGTNKGLNRMEGSGFVRYIYDPAKPEGVSGNTIRYLYRDSRGILWIASLGGGLMRYEPETDSFIHYTKADGLPGNSVVHIVEDREANIWISTQSGLAVWDRSTGLFRDFSLSEELADREFTNGGARGPDGSLYFGALGVVYRVDPRRYEHNTHRPEVALTEVLVRGKSAARGLAAPALEGLRLGYRENSVVFRFAALDFREPSRNRFAYRLEGFDADWVDSGSRNTAVYTNLPGGHYTFRVKASNNDGLWNEEGLRLPVVVAAPPWRSPLAHAIYVLATTLLGYFAATLSGRREIGRKSVEIQALNSELAGAKERLGAFADRDALTGLANRRRFDESLREAFRQAERAHQPLSVLLVDLDFFDAFNALHGHESGDDCLRRTAACLAGALGRPGDLVARYGGGRFSALLPDADADAAVAAGERLRAAIEALAIPHAASRVASCVTVSVGCASIVPETGASPSALVTAAERALCAAKERGRNRVAF